jgi:DNA-binding MarR family transcriptional regulator
MGEIEREGAYSQRELSRRLNISLGLVNTFIKRLVNKGYFKVTTMPRNRVKYFLTPKGLARKSKLTVEYLRYSVNLYREIKKLLMNKFSSMEEDQIKTTLFFGAGEVAEQAYLYLQLTNIELIGIVDPRRKGSRFFGFTVEGMERLGRKDWDVILLTHLDETEQEVNRLLEAGIDTKEIVTI